MILTVTLNPSVDHALFVDSLRLNDANRVRRVERDAGGKGVNVSRVIHGLGGETLATGFLGGGMGAYVRETLSREGVPNDFAAIQDETRLNFSIETNDGNPPTCVYEPGPQIDDFELSRLLEKISGHLPQASWLALGGSAPPNVDAGIYRRIGSLARDAGVPFALDADGEPLRMGLEAAPSLIKPNVAEASRLVGRSLGSLEDCIGAAREISRMIGGEGNGSKAIVVVSRGADGAVMVQGAETWIGRSPSVKCVSTVGSGDSMVGAMLHFLGESRSPREALAFGLAAGAATASKEGSGLADVHRIQELLPAVVVERHG